MRESPSSQTLPQAESANLHFVTPTLAIGGDVDAYDDDLAGMQIADLEAHGITHVVEVRMEWNDTETFAAVLPHISYLHHGMDDAGQAGPASWFERAIRWIEAAGPEAIVLTHCHMGINRGPSLGFAVLLAQGWDPVEAIAAIRSARPQANVWTRDATSWCTAGLAMTAAGGGADTMTTRSASPNSGTAGSRTSRVMACSHRLER